MFSINAQTILTNNAVFTFNLEDEHEKGKLIVSKTLSDQNPDTNASFNFAVTLSKTGETVSQLSTVAIKRSGTTEREEPLSFINGSATFSLKHGESLEIELPTTYNYVVTETPATGYRVVTPATGSTNGTITNGQVSTAAFTNRRDTSSLTITKTVTGKLGSRDMDFEFTITLKDSNNSPLTGTFPYSGSKSGDLTFNAQGQAVISLAHGESVTITDIPISTKYTVEEADYSSDGYKVRKTGDTGVITDGGKRADFVNDKDGNVPTGIGFKIPFLGLGISIAGIAAVMTKRKKKKEEEL